MGIECEHYKNSCQLFSSGFDYFFANTNCGYNRIFDIKHNGESKKAEPEGNLVHCIWRPFKCCQPPSFSGYRLNGNKCGEWGLILGAGPLLTAILSSILLRNKPTGIQVLGFLLGGAGVTFIVLSGNKGISSLTPGDFFVFLSILSQALSFIVISKASKTLDPRLLTGYMLIFEAILL